jgi:hypothetical protein
VYVCVCLFWGVTVRMMRLVLTSCAIKLISFRYRAAGHNSKRM